MLHKSPPAYARPRTNGRIPASRAVIAKPGPVRIFCAATPAFLRGWELTDSMQDSPPTTSSRLWRCLEACAAANLTPSTLKRYDGRYRRFLTHLLATGETPPFPLALLSPQNVRRCTGGSPRSLGRPPRWAEPCTDADDLPPDPLGLVD